MKSLRAFFASRLGRLVLHDGALAVGVAAAYLQTTAQPIDRGVLIAAGVLAVKAFLRLILPVPAAKPAPKGDGGVTAIEAVVVVLVVVVILMLAGVLR